MNTFPRLPRWGPETPLEATTNVQCDSVMSFLCWNFNLRSAKPCGNSSTSIRLCAFESQSFRRSTSGSAGNRQDLPGSESGHLRWKVRRWNSPIAIYCNNDLCTYDMHICVHTRPFYLLQDSKVILSKCQCMLGQRITSGFCCHLSRKQHVAFGTGPCTGRWRCHML